MAECSFFEALECIASGQMMRSRQFPEGDYLRIYCGFLSYYHADFKAFNIAFIPEKWMKWTDWEPYTYPPGLP